MGGWTIVTHAKRGFHTLAIFFKFHQPRRALSVRESCPHANTFSAARHSSAKATTRTATARRGFQEH